MFFYLRLWVKLCQTIVIYYLKEIHKSDRIIQGGVPYEVLSVQQVRRGLAPRLSPLFCTVLAPVSLYPHYCAVRPDLILLPFLPCSFLFCIAYFKKKNRVGVKAEEDAEYVAFCLSSIHPFIPSTNVQGLFGDRPGLTALNVFFSVSSLEPVRQ